MTWETVVKGILLLDVAFALSGCGLFGGNPRTGIALLAKGCLQDPKETGPKCLPGTQLTITPYIPVWGNETGPYYDITHQPSDTRNPGFSGRLWKSRTGGDPRGRTLYLG